MQRDIPPGMTASEVIQLTLGPEALDQLTVIIQTEDGDPAPARPALPPVQTPTPIAYDDRGESPMDVLRRLADLCGMEVELVGTGISVGNTRTSRAFSDVAEAIAVLRTRIEMSNKPEKT